MIEKSFLVQKFAKLRFGQFHVVGYSVSGEETFVQVQEKTPEARDMAAAQNALKKLG